MSTVHSFARANTNSLTDVPGQAPVMLETEYRVNSIMFPPAGKCRFYKIPTVYITIL